MTEGKKMLDHLLSAEDTVMLVHTCANVFSERMLI